VMFRGVARRGLGRYRRPPPRGVCNVFISTHALMAPPKSSGVHPRSVARCAAPRHARL
jgi:hypothetical protein